MRPLKGRRAWLGALVIAAFAVVLFPRQVTGTIEEQRARLPPPAECSDPVEGVWMGLKRDARYGEWYEFTLNVRRAAEGQDGLVGEITSHYWYGGEEDAKPPPCDKSAMEVVVKMPGRGKFADGEVAFGASTWTVEKIVCGHMMGTYNADNFSGKVNPELQEFQSVNNDGGRSVNEPHVFRRIRCFDPPRKRAALDVKPPSFAPAKRAGCGR